MNNTRRNKMLTFMLVGAVGLASLWVAGNTPSIDVSTRTLESIKLKTLNLGIGQDYTQWQMQGSALTVKSNGNANTQGENRVYRLANQVGGSGNAVNVPADNASLGSVIVGGEGNTVNDTSSLGAIVASKAATLSDSSASVIVASHSGSLQGQNSAIVASENVTVHGSGSMVLASENASITNNARGSLAMGKNVEISHNGVFAFNGKNKNLTSARDHTFIVNVDNGFLIGKAAPGASASDVPLQVNGAIRVGASDKSNAIVLKKNNTNQCLCVNGMALSHELACKAVCGGDLSSQAGTWSCPAREYVFETTDYNNVYSHRQNPSLPRAECSGERCEGDAPVCGDRCIDGYEIVQNQGKGTFRCEKLGTWSCPTGHRIFVTSDFTKVVSSLQNPSLPRAECSGGRCKGEPPICGERCVRDYHYVLNQDGKTFRCEQSQDSIDNPLQKTGTWQCLPKKKIAIKQVCEGTYRKEMSDRGFYCSLKGGVDGSQYHCVVQGASSRGLLPGKDAATCNGPRESWQSASSICALAGRTTNSPIGINGDLPECPRDICHSNLIPKEYFDANCSSLSVADCSRKSGCRLTETQVETDSNERAVQCVKNGVIVSDSECDSATKEFVSCGESNSEGKKLEGGTTQIIEKGFSCSVNLQISPTKKVCVIQGASARTYEESITTQAECISRGGIWNSAKYFCPEQGGTAANKAAAYLQCPSGLCVVQFVQ